MSRTPPIDIQTPPRHHYVSDPFSVSVSSYLATSPIAQEILARDIEECSTEDEDSGTESEDEFDSDPHAAPLSFHPPGSIAYGTCRPAVGPHGHDNVPATTRDIEESRNAERSLLRDNHILPPKNPRPTYETPLRRLYRRIFSTKVRDANYDFSSVAVRVSTKANEASPLLQTIQEVGPPTPNEEHNRWEAAVAANVLRTTWQREAKTLLQYSGPLILTFLLHYSVTIGSVLTVGRIGMIELGAVSLATMTANITCYAPLQGLATSLDTLCAQAFGSGHKHLVGLQAQRMTYLLWILIIPIAAIWLFSEPILVSLVPDAPTARLAAQYLRILVLGTPGVAALESGKRFVQAQGLFHATTYVLAVGAPVSFFLNWFFVWKLEFGFNGAAAAMAVTQNLLPILLVLYVRFVEGSQCWNGLSKRAFSNWGPMIKLALPGMIMIEAQFSVLEILTLSAGQFGTAPLAAQSVLVTITSTAFNVPFPLSIAASTRVANLIGARLTDAARTSAKVSLVASLIVGLCNLTILAVFQYQLPQAFTKDQGVVAIVSQVMPICATMQIFDSLAAISHGLLRGIGRQNIGSYTNLFSYYFVALPIALSTAFGLGWKLAGLWTGVTIGLATVTTIELLYLLHVDWEGAVRQAEDRMRSEGTCHMEGK